MILIANLAGLVLALISLLLGGLISNRLAGGHLLIGALCSSVLMVVLDVGYRRYRQLKLLGRGPAVFWVPLWIWGVLGVIGVASDLLRHR